MIINGNATVFDAEKAISKAIEDYTRHISAAGELSEVTPVFISRLAKDSWAAKTELRELFRKSPCWVEELQAMVINGNRTHNPNGERIEKLATELLMGAVKDKGRETMWDVLKAIEFFTSTSDDKKQKALAALNELAPKAYHEGKKLTRIFRDFCKALGVTEKTVPKFNQLYAKIADELTAKKIDFKLFVSINPAHFLTMSNPKGDERGETMVSCHSLNDVDHPYQNGCIGYARDKYSFIAFTVANPNDAESLNNRKTSRQIFAYKPYNGVLLQSRMYITKATDSYGGVDGDTEEGKLYRDLIQREISECENAVNSWIKSAYSSNTLGVVIDPAKGFGGYPDWTYDYMGARIAVRKDKVDKFKNFKIGKAGLCVVCGEEHRKGLVCCEHKHEHEQCRHCEHCGELCKEEELQIAYDEYGNEIEVCGACLASYYEFCDMCGRWHRLSGMVAFHNEWICLDCAENNCFKCSDCGEYHDWENATRIGDNYVCLDCLEQYYSCCDVCGEYVPNDDTTTAIDADGCELTICIDCADNNFNFCYSCGCAVHPDITITDSEGCNYCPDCGRYIEEEKEDDTDENA